MARSQAQGYKVTNARRTKTVGIACSSLDELLVKACKKFEIKRTTGRIYLADGTLVDSEDYFGTVPPQTVLTLLLEGEKCQTGADLIYNALKSINVQYLTAGRLAEDFLQEDIKEKIRVLSKLVSDESEEEPLIEWIKGVETSCKSKEAFMESRCRDRMRSYFYKASSDIKSSLKYQTHSRLLSKVLEELKALLAKRSFQGSYFNRLKSSEALCDSSGLFKCQGSWSKNLCNHCGGDGHRINPYLSRETRVVFSTWNLDHKIERSRSIVPSILEAAALCPPNSSLDVPKIYELLFTTTNLKLVHIVCHDKGAHVAAICRPTDLLARAKSAENVKRKSLHEHGDRLPSPAS